MVALDDPLQEPGREPVHDHPVSELAPEVLYAILRLRSEVFVVEQACVFLDIDGLDLAPGARQLWIAGADGAVLATARVLADGASSRIGRIATRSDHRGQGHAGRLLEHFLASSAGPWQLNGQSYLIDWYRGFGFEIDGEEYLDDGIPHVPMARPLPS